MTLPTTDLTDVDTFVEQRHHEVFAWLRANEPVYRDKAGFWALTRYDDVVAAYVDHATFSSAGGPMLGGSFSTMDADSAANRMLVASDQPRHRMLRQLLHRVFGPGYVTAVAHRVEELVDAAVDRALADGGCDFATDIAPELPAAALMVMVGVSRAQAHELIGMTRRMIGFRDPNWVDTSGDERLRLALLQSDIFEFFADLLRARRRDPGDDLVSILATAEVNGRRLPEEDILYNCMNVAVGGNETSSYTAVAGLLALIENPDQHDLLLADPDLLDPAVNEMLRWASTNAYVLRVPTTDVEIGGTLIRAREPVTLWNVSANRDESQFPDGDRFLVTRSPNRHITYGVGIHRCIGSPVAQVELPALFRRLLTSRVRFEQAGEVVRLRSNFIQGITSLPVRMSA
ncbi:cytochrome P450 [Actinokineospora bangkokensis]|uniref:Cytochrome n=1 Tax=Actinokineospora bangkokensis TaxID=1193682 RepID=A0A1Q9LIJ8_9PSEU|nr:cytochrome P450 [Actinokineospora bangkokensis]OLR91877.1 cytochrome [Actinokineospora bangkokensis]